MKIITLSNTIFITQMWIVIFDIFFLLNMNLLSKFGYYFHVIILWKVASKN